MDLNHQILANSNTYTTNLLYEFLENNKLNFELKKIKNILIKEHKSENLKYISKFVNEFLPFIPIVSHKEIQIISDEVLGVKYDPRGILANIQKLKLKEGEL